MTPALVIGGGLAGAATAIRLAAGGREVTLFEREPGPVDKVCGEFLSREAGIYLTALGLDLTALGAVSIDAVRWCAPRHTVETPLPFSALSLSRRVLDEALLQRASSAGATIRCGVKVTALTRQPTGWVTHLKTAASSRQSPSFSRRGNTTCVDISDRKVFRTTWSPSRCTAGCYRSTRRTSGVALSWCRSTAATRGCSRSSRGCRTCAWWCAERGFTIWDSGGRGCSLRFAPSHPTSTLGWPELHRCGPSRWQPPRFLTGTCGKPATDTGGWATKPL